LPADRARVHFDLAVTSAHQPWGLIWRARSVHESGGRNCTQRSHRCSPLGLSSYCTSSFSAFCCRRVPGGRGHEGDGEGALKDRDRSRGQSLTWSRHSSRCLAYVPLAAGDTPTIPVVIESRRHVVLCPVNRGSRRPRRGSMTCSDSL
jgi:hypothetical protein